MDLKLTWIVTVFLGLCGVGTSSPKCPDKCRCYKTKRAFIADCSRRKLTVIPKGFPPNITKLVLDRNLITRLPAQSFQGMLGLREISIKDNYIGSVDSQAFSGLGNLTKVQLTKNQLSVLPKDVFSDNKKLTQLFLTSNHFEIIPNFNPMPPNFYTLGLDANKIVNASIPGGYKAVKKLSLTLSNNHKLGNIDVQDFENARNGASGSGKLTVLRLSQCGLKNIQNGSLVNQTQLKSLSLSNNDQLTIQNLMDIFEDLQSSAHLSYLDMSGIIGKGKGTDQLKFDALKGKKNLRTVYLSRNNIQVIRNGFLSAFQSVNTLFLKHCEIRVAEENAFEGMNQLLRLDLALNKLQIIPTFKANMRTLKRLDLSNNQDLTEIKDNAFSQLTRLTYLNLNYCGITKVHLNSFVGLAKLQTLELVTNKLPLIPGKTFLPVVSLKTLNLRNNRLATIPRDYSNIFNGLTNLKQLDLSSNQMSSLPTTVFKPLIKLTFLDLHDNDLGSVIQQDTGVLFSSQKNLLSLNLGNNDIITIPDELFKDLTSLENLQLSNNILSHWGTRSFNKTQKLKQLSMAYNQISIVNETSASSFPSSMNWNLSGNPFNCWCDLRWFRRWVNSTNVKLLNLTGYTCSSPQRMSGERLLDFNPDAIICWHFPWYYALAGGITGATLLIITMVSVLYRYRWPIRYRWFMLRRKSKKGADDEQALVNAEYKFDALICFSWQQPDRKWVDDFLLPAMDADTEDNNHVCDLGRKFKLWHDERDLDVGKGKAEIFEAIEASKMMILVISKKFHQDDLSKFILNTLAPIKSAKSPYGHHSLIFIILDKKADMQIPQWYHKALHEGEQLEWTDDLEGRRYFWMRLHDRLNQELEI